MRRTIDADYGFWRSVRDGLSLVARGVAIAVLAALIGLIPAVGGVLSTVFAVSLTGWLIADELSSRALSARGLDHTERRRLRRSHRARVLGFGVATQLCFMIPLGAVATMPAAVAGATDLARSLLEPEPAAGRPGSDALTAPVASEPSDRQSLRRARRQRHSVGGIPSASTTARKLRMPARPNPARAQAAAASDLPARHERERRMPHPPSPRRRRRAHR